MQACVNSQNGHITINPFAPDSEKRGNMETMAQQTKANNTWSKYRDRIHVADTRPKTFEEIACEKDSKDQDRHIYRRSWNEESPEFNRLKRLAFALKIEGITVSPYSAFPERDGFYLYFGNEIDFEFAREWGLSKRQTQSLRSSDEPSIFINYRAEFPIATLAHEIGHHIYRLAGLTETEKGRPISETLNRLFPRNSYVQKSSDVQEIRDEIHAECFAEYLTVSVIRRGVERECEAILSRVHRHNPEAVKLVEQYRTTLLKRTRRTGTPRERSINSRRS
jgi:hypothetical protein